MAAIDMFEEFIGWLSERDRSLLDPLIRQQRQELLSARSEEARVRLARQYVKDLHDRLGPSR